MTPSELRALAEARDEMRKRAMAWVYDAGTGVITSRDEAVNEQEMALDVIALLDQLAAAEAECARLKKAAPVMLTVMAFLADEADIKGLREIGIWYGENEPDHIEIWLDAEKARKK